MAYLDLTGLGYFKDKLIDPTLSVAGKAAEDKAVGDAVADFLPTDTASGAIASFTDGAENTPVKALTVDIEPVQSGSGDPSPDNVRPISGFAQANVTRTGVNIADNNRFVTETTSRVGGITYNESTGFYEGDIRELYYTWGFPNNANGFVHGFKASRVCASITIKSLESTGSNFIVAFKYADGTESNRSIAYTTTESRGSAVSDAGKTVVAVGLSYGSSRVVAFKDFQIEFSDTPSDYEPYQGESITIDLGETRYGGTLDVVNKVLTVDRACVTFDGTESGWAWYEPFKQAYISNVLSSAPAKYTGDYYVGWISSALAPVANAYRGDNVGNFATVISAGSGVAFSCSADGTLDGFKAFAQANPIQFCYLLATPITVPLSAQEMTTLLGQNNIFSDAGDVDVTYRADVKLYIQKYIASMVSAQGGE